MTGRRGKRPIASILMPCEKLERALWVNAGKIGSFVSVVYLFSLCFPHWSIFMHLILSEIRRIHLNMNILNSCVSLDLLTSDEKRTHNHVCTLRRESIFCAMLYFGLG